MLPFLDLKAVTASHGEEIREAVISVVDSGWYLLGERVGQFERDYAQYIGTRHAIACANGLDALTLMLRAYVEMGCLHEGDEVIVPANTFIATVLAITQNGLNPVFVEPDAGTLNMDLEQLERSITPRTRAIMLVHLYGRLTYTERIAELCRCHDLLLFEDNAQAHGCTYGSQRTGSLGDAAAHSFYPGKNLGALGDAGCITTDDDALAEVIRSLANYGSSRKYVFRYSGRNSRMDEIQAAVLSVKLRYLDADNDARRDIANIYYNNIKGAVRLPRRLPDAENVYHLFPIFCEDRRQRDLLRDKLQSRGIQTLIHYPIPPHRQDCYKQYSHLSLPVTERLADTELSLPISPVMTCGQALEVCECINH
ncbi:MAG: DegT/DnrJ/EryC1/StrS family aminotransferase [Bacteroidaceae bacterium]|nr:DegT/DnrJ/EryC1/StrS family aminotransferase [Bacteroidaceae bacterium]